MLWSRCLIPTQKNAPADSPSEGFDRLIRAGFIRQMGAGLYELLPLAARVLRKIEAIARQEMESAGASEVLVPSLQPVELWQRAGRGDDPRLLSVIDCGEREGRLAFNSVPALAELVSATVRSYKQLPCLLFRIGELTINHSNFDAGLTSLRDNHVMELLAFEATDSQTRELALLPSAFASIARGIFSRIGLKALEADDLQGKAFVMPSNAGSGGFLQAGPAVDSPTYVATSAVARTGPRDWTWGGDPITDAEKVHTPGAKTVDDVAKQLGVPRSQVLKTLVYRTDAIAPTLESGVNAKWVIAVVRGDHSVSLEKLAAAAREEFKVNVRFRDEPEDLARQFVLGFVGPEVAIRKLDAVLIVDYDAANNADWVVGANEVDYHTRHFHWFRDCGDRLADPRKTVVADIRMAQAGDPAPGGGTLTARRGTTLAMLNAISPADLGSLVPIYTDAGGQSKPMRISRLEIRLERILTVLSEVAFDADGLNFPSAVAPFGCIVCPLKYEGEAKTVADRLSAELEVAGIDVLLDDRDIRPGAKFAEADLIGVPIRVTIGERGLKEESVEIKRRGEPAKMVKIDAATEAIRVLCHQ